MNSDWAHSFVFLLFALSFSCHQPTSSLSEDIATIKAMSKARAGAFNQGDAEAIATHFTEKAFLMAPGSPKKEGPVEVAAYYQSIFDKFETQLESGYEEVKVDGDLAFGRGFAKVTLYSKSNKDTLYSTSKYLNILERQADGNWKITHDIWNDN